MFTPIKKAELAGVNLDGKADQQFAEVRKQEPIIFHRERPKAKDVNAKQAGANTADAIPLLAGILQYNGSSKHIPNQRPCLLCVEREKTRHQKRLYDMESQKKRRRARGGSMYVSQFLKVAPGRTAAHNTIKHQHSATNRQSRWRFGWGNQSILPIATMHTV
jgi:hypothetical protein